MPPLALHTVVAKGIADRLGHAVLDAERGHLYLGSTAPDIRVITRWDRRATHFFDLSCFEEQSGVAELLRAHPELADIGRLKEATVAFMAGYISHLVMDETWISDIYRPFFGERSPMGGAVEANIMDRVLQFALDTERRGDRQLIAHVLEQVARCDLGVEVGFIEGEALRRWRDIIVQAVDAAPDWERFRYIAGGQLQEAGVDTPEAFAEFLRGVPELVAETKRYLTPDRVRAFMGDSVTRGVVAVKEYLGCV
ncbi:MAG: hypothetical protein ACE5KW_04290 [Dehalococcoidia bacterium]